MIKRILLLLTCASMAYAAEEPVEKLGAVLEADAKAIRESFATGDRGLFQSALLEGFNRLSQIHSRLQENVQSKQISRLHRAVMNKDCEKLQEYLDQGDDINVQDARGVTPLLTAVQANDCDLALFLLERGANHAIQSFGQDKWNALHYAIYLNSPEMVKLLIRYKVDVNARMDDVAPLHRSVDRSNVIIAKLLLDAGADINARIDGMSVIQYAVNIGEFELVKLFRLYIMTEEEIDAHNNLLKSLNENINKEY